MLEEYLRVLAHERRRQLLTLLLDRADQEEVAIPDSVIQDDADRDAVRLAFHHMHLPKLDECGLVEWDRDAGVVTKGPNFDNVRPLVEVVERIDTSLQEEN
jgi:hypothetical protein